MSSRSVYIETYGCQMNASDSNDLAGLLEARGFSVEGSPDDARIIILNTCAVRKHAEDKVFSRLGALYKKYRDSRRILVIGCVAQHTGEELRKSFPFVDHIIGPRHIYRIPELLESGTPAAVLCGEGNHGFMHSGKRREYPFLASVSIIHGCSNFCSYCIVPFVRGPEISRSSSEVLDEVRRLAGEGVIEILLLGQNVNSYGLDSGDISFAALLEELNSVNGLERIRFLTSHPKDFSDELVNAVTGLDRVCRYVHLPLQSGSDRILKAMNRKYTLSYYTDLVAKLRDRANDIAVSTDILVGFPGETEEDHRQTMEAVRSTGFDDAYMFRYSVRPGTASARMSGGVPEGEKQRRLKEVIELQNRITREKAGAYVGRTCVLLAEEPSRKDPGELLCRTSTNKTVVVPTGTGPDRIAPGKIFSARITAIRGRTLCGQRTLCGEKN